MLSLLSPFLVTTALTKSVLVARRQEFRRKRWLWRLLGLWRVVLAAGLAGGLVWLAEKPFWQLPGPLAVSVRGNLHLSTEQVNRALDLRYPQSILAITPDQLEARLLTALPLESVQVTRQVWPPSLAIEVRECEPVAAAPLPGRLGVVDRAGRWIALQQYRGLPLPKLTVWGYTKSRSELWKALYEQVSRSPIRIQVIDLRDSSNLILRTELGQVHFGSFSPQFESQLRRLDQLREVVRRYQKSEIAFIDLRSLELPTLRLKAALP